MILKPGASIEGVKWQLFWAALVFEELLKEYGYYCVITSGTDSMNKHGGGDPKKTLHDDGLALDFRNRGLSLAIQQEIADRLRKRLGPQYQVVIEKDHFHVEYDPK